MLCVCRAWRRKKYAAKKSAVKRPVKKKPTVRTATKPVKQPKVQKSPAVKSLGERMLDNFTRSTASGAGYTMGRTISRGILGVFGIK